MERSLSSSVPAELRLNPAMSSETYLDANASAPLRPEARAAVLAALDLGPGNASSAHGAGRRLRRTLGDARDAVAALVGARPSEVVFTSGATEANALGLLGALAAAPGALVTTRAEHASIARVADRLAASGADVRRVGVDRWGRFDADEVLRAAEGASVVAAVLAQPVTGAIEPVAEIGRGLRGAALHVDAAQAVGRIEVDVAALGAATAALSAHKFGGPAGVGALVVREGAPWRNPFADGAQERGRRAGTEAVALAAGFGAAARAAAAPRREEATRSAALVAELRAGLAALPACEILTPTTDVLPGTLLASFDGCPGDATMAALDALGFRVSTGSACSSGARLPPEVLVAGGRSPAEAARAIRISLSWRSSRDDVRALLATIPEVLARVRRAQPTS
jgi:cysteine desulfurase